MKRINKNCQVVVRITAKLDKKIEAAADKRGLTKAAWARQLFIETLDGSKNGPAGGGIGISPE